MEDNSFWLRVNVLFCIAICIIAYFIYSYNKTLNETQLAEKRFMIENGYELVYGPTGASQWLKKR